MSDQTHDQTVDQILEATRLILAATSLLGTVPAGILSKDELDIVRKSAAKIGGVHGDLQRMLFQIILAQDEKAQGEVEA